VTNKRRRASPLLLALVLLAAFGLAGCGRPASGEPVITVLGSWTGDEQRGFLAMVRGFEKKYGIRVDYTGTRAADAVLSTDLKDGNPPDLAALATPGELHQYAKEGLLVPINGALDIKTMASQYGPGWRTLMQAAGPHGTRQYYAIFVKATLKSVIWYDPRRFPASDLGVLTSPGLTWSQLTKLTKQLQAGGTSPWCIGMQDGSNSGWPGTDWIEDILLHQSGPQVYGKWVAGKQRWNSTPVRKAWQTFGQVANTPGLVHGGTAAELANSYGTAGQPLFTSPHGCYLDHEASFIPAFYAQDKLGPSAHGAHPAPKTDFDFIPFPPVTSAAQGSEEVAGDLLGMFRGSSAARKLIAYLTTPQAQEAWISRPGSGAISVNRLVLPSDYPDQVSGELAKNLTDAVNVQFDASDSMPPVMESAFNNAVLEYLDNPGQLTVILRSLDQVQKATYQ